MYFQVLSPEFELSDSAMEVLDTLHLRKPNRKLVKRQRIESTMVEESAGHIREDGYKLKAAGVANVFPIATYARVSAY